MGSREGKSGAWWPWRPTTTSKHALQPPTAQALVGRLLCGKWRIERLLSEGGMSTVYAASHRNGRRVAIKVLRPDLAADVRMRKRFQREGYLANRVCHEGAVAVLDDDIADDGVVFLVMDLLVGTNLAEIARNGPRAPNEVAFLMDRLLGVLSAAHANGIVHRDVKPGNIFLTAKGEVRLLDFGIAGLRETSTGFAPTASAAMLGTPGFMAPEQARGHWTEVDARTDLWAVGATMFQLLAGRPVHEASTRQEALIAAGTRPCPPLRSLRDDVPEVLAELVDRALRFHAHERWQDAGEMRCALRAIRSELPPYAPPRGEGAGATTDDWSVDSTITLAGTASHEDAQDSVPPPAQTRRSAWRSLFVWAALVTAATGLGLALRSPAPREPENDVRVRPRAISVTEPTPSSGALSWGASSTATPSSIAPAETGYARSEPSAKTSSPTPSPTRRPPIPPFSPPPLPSPPTSTAGEAPGEPPLAPPSASHPTPSAVPVGLPGNAGGDAIPNAVLNRRK